MGAKRLGLVIFRSCDYLALSIFGRQARLRALAKECLRFPLKSRISIGKPVRRVREQHSLLKVKFMASGTVKWFNAQKGFGFIQPSSGGPDVFVHISAVERAGLSGLNEGQKISYEIVADKRTGKSSADRLQAE